MGFAEERIFIICARPFTGVSGGGSGVNCRLYLANKKYKNLGHTIHIFLDAILDGQDELLPDPHISQKRKSKFFNTLRKLSLPNVIVYEKKLVVAKKMIKRADECYHFKLEDIFIFCDTESAYAFSLYDTHNQYRHISIVYHQQGSLYNEWNAYNRVNACCFHKYLDNIQMRTYQKFDIVGFPSYGTKETLCKNAKNLGLLLDSKRMYITYNGFDPLELKQKIVKTGDVEGKDNYLKFITVSALNYAKGVERIPRFISQIVNSGIDIRWTLVGNGVMAEKLEEEIGRYDLKGKVVWIKEFISHEQLLSILQEMDYFVCFHRWSIFDFAIIEAMAYGVIPILTNVGGNMEMVENERSGFLIDDLGDPVEINNLIEIMKDEKKREDMKNICMERQNNLFSEKAFLDGYKALVDALKAV